MIKAVLKNDGDDIFLIGLSEGNIERLKDNRPMIIEHPGWPRIFIMYGKTEEDIIEILREKATNAEFRGFPQ